MLDSLTIKNFRCLEDFSVDRLGRVNLIVGKNNGGKSTVLEALRLYAGNAQRPLLEEIAIEHDEMFARFVGYDAGDADQSAPYQDFFTGRRYPAEDDRTIQIGPVGAAEDLLEVAHVLLLETEEQVNDGPDGEHSIRVRRRRVAKSEAADWPEGLVQALMVRKGSRQFPPIRLDRPMSRMPYAMAESGGGIPCSTIGTQFTSSDELADVWDSIVFTEHEEVVKQALRIIAPDFQNLTFVRNEPAGGPPARGRLQRGAKVKLADLPRPVPLNSLGDGMWRVLQLALKIFPAKGGFLLIDEFENGLHYSVQARVWELLFEMAQRLDIQVFATTHSWDCIDSFAKVAKAREDIDGVLFRVGKSARASDRGRVMATVFDEEALHGITQAQAEVR